MERSAFFNSVNNDRVYNAQSFAEYFASFIANGVFPNPSNNLQVFAYDGFQLKVSPGKAWINGYFYVNDDDLYITLDLPDAVLSRIDAVVLRYSLADRNIKVAVKKGAFSSSPTPPTLQRDASIYELCLAQVYVAAGATSITQADITDTRLSTELCGISHALVEQVDTTTIFNQYKSWYEQYIAGAQAEFDAWFQSVQDILDENTAMQLQSQIDSLSSSLSSHASAKQVHGISGSYYIAKTSRSDQLPAWDDIQGKPSSFTPSAHASTHKTGGGDVIAPSDIGAASSTDLTNHGNSKQTHGASGSYYLAKTSRSDQLPAWSDVQGKPSSYTPSAHANSHKSGGSDAITPADIGAASSTDLAIHGNSKQTHGASGSYYLAKTSRSDQLPAWSDIQGKPSSYTPSAHANSHKSGGSDAITPADIGAAVNVVYTATIQAANWSGSEAPFSQSVSVSGILSTDTPIIDVVMSGTYGTDIERSSQWNYVYRAVTGANSITFYAKTKPTIDLPIQIKVVR